MARSFLATLLVAVLFMTPGICWSRFSSYQHGLTLYYGLTFRWQDISWNVLSMERWYDRGACTWGKYDGYGASYEWRGSKDFLWSIRYFKAPFQTVPFSVGLNPSFYDFDGQQGLNCAPEFGFYSHNLHAVAGWSWSVYYGYDVGVVNPDHYAVDRHRFTVKVGIALDTRRIARTFRKKPSQVHDSPGSD